MENNGQGKNGWCVNTDAKQTRNANLTGGATPRILINRNGHQAVARINPNITGGGAKGVAANLAAAVEEVNRSLRKARNAVERERRARLRAQGQQYT